MIETIIMIELITNLFGFLMIMIDETKGQENLLIETWRMDSNAFIKIILIVLQLLFIPVIIIIDLIIYLFIWITQKKTLY